MNFVDRVEVVFSAGAGGDGFVSFRHEKFRPMGGPDGGDGGRGGDIVLVASNRENTLSAFRYKKEIKAPSGQPGSKSKRHGKNAPPLELMVPVGTVVSADDKILADLDKEGERYVVAKGGKGGFGNAHFVSSTRQAPRVAERGETGEQIKAVMEIKLIADVGLVGLPNAGKSTLLSVVSNAHPEIADYPFTTLVPNLGVVDIDENTSLLFADIPGLIAGASRGKGLGDEFLRHIERTRVLIHLIDAYTENLEEAYRTIIEELKNYKVDLSGRPQVVALTKTEGMPEAEVSKKVKKLQKVAAKKSPVVAISSRSRKGVDEMLHLVARLMKSAPAEKTAEKTKDLPVIGLREDDNSWSVEEIKAGYLVRGAKIEQFARRTQFGDFHGEQRLRDIMHKTGIMRELQRQGLEPGQTIKFGEPVIGKLEY